MEVSSPAHLLQVRMLSPISRNPDPPFAIPFSLQQPKKSVGDFLHRSPVSTSLKNIVVGRPFANACEWQFGQNDGPPSFFDPDVLISPAYFFCILVYM
jgi:hypothetical protein